MQTYGHRMKFFVYLQRKKYVAMNTEMIETIREYFKTQPVLKALRNGVTAIIHQVFTKNQVSSKH